MRDDPNHTLSWGVWEPVAYDSLLAYGHDDLLVSAALCALLDDAVWPGAAEGAAVETRDPLDEIDATAW